jgi:hypothetical protein
VGEGVGTEWAGEMQRERKRKRKRERQEAIAIHKNHKRNKNWYFLVYFLDDFYAYFFE